MYCKSCLAANPEGATKCVQCGAPLEGAVPPAPPSSVPGDFELQPEEAKPASSFEPPPLPISPTSAEPESQVASPEAGGPMPPDHKQSAIIMLVISMLMFPLGCCCCTSPMVGIIGLIFSILALIEGAKVKPAWEAGDLAAAEEASKLAQSRIKTGMIAIAIAFVLSFIFYAIWIAINGFASAFSGVNRHFNQ